MECNDRSQSAKLARTEDPRSRPQWNYDVLVYLVQICISKNTVCLRTGVSELEACCL